jgi:hypothetical protein
VAVVADAGPLIALARITRVDLLPALYDEIIVPPTVYREITTEHDFPGAALFAQAAWLRVAPIADLHTVERLPCSMRCVQRAFACHNDSTTKRDDQPARASPDSRDFSGDVIRVAVERRDVEAGSRAGEP